jgi:hypothetical protein
VGPGFFPLDNELNVLPGSLMPSQHEHLVHLGAWMPFGRASQMLTQLLGVQVSEATVRRMTERMGAQVEAAQTEESALPAETEPCGESERKQAISADGAYVPLLKGEWAEVRTVAIGEVEEREPACGKQDAHVTHLSSFSRMTSAATFADLAEGEMRRRGVRQAKAVCAVTDGADGLQGFFEPRRPDAVRILDFPHAAEHLSALAEALKLAGVVLPRDAVDRSLHILKHRGPRPLLRLLEALPSAVCEREAVQEQMGYLRKREALMQYPLYRQQGWPIGSGMVESANKLVLQARLKGAGMHWAPESVNPMLALRPSVCNDRWEEAWQQGEHHLRQQRLEWQQQKAQPRLLALAATLAWLTLRLRPTPPPPVLPKFPASPPAMLAGTSRPSPHHPWKRAIVAFPKGSAKK